MRRIIFKFKMPFIFYKFVTGNGKPTSCVTAVTPTGHPQSFRNRYIIEHIGVVFVFAFYEFPVCIGVFAAGLSEIYPHPPFSLLYVRFDIQCIIVTNIDFKIEQWMARIEKIKSSIV